MTQSPAKAKTPTKTPEKEKVAPEVTKPVSPVKETVPVASTVPQPPVQEASAEEILYCICQTKYDPSRSVTIMIII